MIPQDMKDTLSHQLDSDLPQGHQPGGMVPACKFGLCAHLKCEVLVSGPVFAMESKPCNANSNNVDSQHTPPKHLSMSMMMQLADLWPKTSIYSNRTNVDSCKSVKGGDSVSEDNSPGVVRVRT